MKKLLAFVVVVACFGVMGRATKSAYQGSAMKKFILAGLLCLLLAGCGPAYYYGPIQNLPYVPQKESAELVFIAEELALRSGAITSVYIPSIDGIDAYSLRPDQYVSFPVTPGEHIIKCSGVGDGVMTFSPNPNSIIRINPKIGETVYLYCTAEVEGSPLFNNVLWLNITQIPEDQAQALMKNATHVGAR